MTLRADLAAALARGVEAESVIAANAALGKLDPLLALVARRRVRRLLRRADLEAVLLDDPAQRLRIAALFNEDPKIALDFSDRDAVLARYAELGARPGPNRRGPWFTLGTLFILGALLAAGFFVRRAFAPFDPRETAAGRVLGEGLAMFVARTSNGVNGTALAETRQTLTGPEAQKALGKDTVGALSELLDASGWVVASQNPDGPLRESERFYNGANSLGALMRKGKLPYFVDADIIARAGAPLPLLMSFYIERESEFEAGGTTVRAIDLWRLDTLGIRYGALGYTRPRTPAALVLLDQIESDLVRSVLPALAPGESSELVDDETREQDLPWVTEIERRAGETVRNHYAALSADPHVLEVGRLLAKRRMLVRRWRATVADGGHLLRVPERLIPEANYGKDLHLRVANEELYDWDELHDDLLAKKNYAAFLRLREPYVAGIERHEVEHRLDFARGFRPIPASLCKILGLENPLDAPAGSRQERVSSEFSAYLAQLADAPDSPELELVVLSSILLNANSGGTYWYAALGLFEAIATELGIDPERVVGRGRLERERIATLVAQLLTRNPSELRTAAMRAYEKAYGEPVPHVVKKKTSQNAEWRH
ncbi:MAG TPA: hypothetical protein VGM44_01900 [Polyangiaceae bacterium]